MIPRTWLFCPGNRTDRLRTALDSADVAVADLEDAVPLDQKPAAREEIISALRADPQAAQRIWVRINNDTEHTAADLEALCGATFAGVVVSKAEPSIMRRVADAVTVPLLALVETAAGLWQVRQIAETPRLHSLTLGEYDLAEELDLAPPDIDVRPLHWARSRIVAAAANSCAPPPGPVSTVVANEDQYRKDTVETARFGFFGRMCIHPAQVPSVHESIAPTDREVADAHEVVQAADRAERDGTGVLVIDGKMIDPPIIRRARRVLELAQLP